MQSIKNRLSAALLPLMLALTVSACAGCKRNADGSPSTSVDWGRVVNCAPDVGDLVGTVTEILVSSVDRADPLKVSPAGQDQLGRLAKQHGASTVLCLIDQLTRDWSNPSMAAVAPWRPKAAARGRDFIESHGVTIKRDQ
jgi:hypothetical protein